MIEESVFEEVRSIRQRMREVMEGFIFMKNHESVD